MLRIVKKVSSATGILLLLSIFSFSPQVSMAQGNYQDDYYDDRYDDGDYGQFYNDLSPHGNWMQDPEYGYVWQPRVGNDFRPYYTNGRWAMTDLGNMWMSDYAWGHIPFHYGRWVHSRFYGWLWVPGRTWAPAWVVWRQGGGYYGWAPMGPSINISFNFGNYYNNHYDYWNFIPYNNIYQGSYHRYRYFGFNNNFFSRTTVINNYHSYRNNRFFAGPRRTDVQRHVRNVPVYRVNHTNARGRNSINRNTVNVYSPEIRRNTNSRASQPRNFTRIDNNRRIEYEYGRGNRATGAPRNNVRTGRNNTSVERSGNTTLQQRNNTGRNNNVRRVEPNSSERTTPPNRQVNPNRNNTNNNRRNTEVRSTPPSRNSNRSIEPRQNTNNRNRNNEVRSTPPARNSGQVQPRQNSNRPSGGNMENRRIQQPSRSNQPGIQNRSGAPSGQPSRSSGNMRNSQPSRGGSSGIQSRGGGSNVRSSSSSVSPGRGNSSPSRSGSAGSSRGGSQGRGSR